MAHKFPVLINDFDKEFAVPLNVRELPYYEDDTYGDTKRQVWTIKTNLHSRRVLGYHLCRVLDQHCQHQYDCCGHFYRSVMTHTLRHVKRKEWTVEVVYIRNC